MACWRRTQPGHGPGATERPEVAALPEAGCLGQTLVQQLEQERREHLNDLSAHDDIDWPTLL